MPIPDFQSIMLPLLKFTSDKKEHSTTEALDVLTNEFNLTEEERNQFLPSGNQKVFITGFSGQRHILKMSGLIENTKRSHFKITERGLNVLKEKPTLINIKFLKRFPDVYQLEME
ncbi:MAG: winged helix-turn-helix domain-containing protein [Bacteroidota bacterium]|nr:winged helix-turn-helix domain-containing protein [Bacteroidota bacterium]